MRNHDAPFLGCPPQYGRIIRASEADVLDSHDVQIRVAPQQAAYDIVVQVFVSGQP
jgi:citrate lyase gamma subunit